MEENGLARAREIIDQVDREMAALFERRMSAVEQVIAYKQAHGLPILDSSREQSVLDRNTARIENPVYREYYRDFLRDLMGLSKQYQQVLAGADTVAYPGVEGSYSHIAMRRLFPRANGRAYTTFGDVVQAVDRGEVACGVIPFENSYTGEVGMTMDLLYQYDVHVTRMYDLPVSHNLLGVKGASLAGIRQIYSHEQALSQCRRYLSALDAEQIPFVNTALAAKYVSEAGDPSKAAIASRETAGLYGLEILVEEINTSAENTTRFAVIARQAPASGERFSLLFTVSHSAGQLAGAMQIIARYGFNMESIRSRSVKNVPWQYYFYVEIVGDASSPQAQAMLEELRQTCEQLKLLGVYNLCGADSSRTDRQPGGIALC